MTPAFNVTALAQWMTQEGLKLDGPLEVRRIGQGHSNLTYGLSDKAGRRWVARRPPLGELLQSAHDVVREARIMAALGETAVAVPQIYGVCRDSSVCDVPLVLMEHVEGLVVDTMDQARQADRSFRAAVGPAMMGTLADIHEVDLDAVGLGDLASTSPYAQRQLKRWSRQWEASKTRELASLAELTALLEANIPQQKVTSLVHGDLHIRNVMLDPGSGAVRAAFDWELSTLGDPLSDVGTTLAYWPEAGEPSHGLFAASALPGFATRAELVEAYIARTGADGASIGFWHVLGLWKIAIIVEGIVRRSLENPANAAQGESVTPDQVDALIDFATGLARDYVFVGQ